MAELVKQSRTLIILDGLEPLQNPPPVETGRIKDPALVAFLRELARQNRGLVVITTRLAVDDLKDCVGDTVIERDLENLSDEAGAAYLRHLGVDGSDAERQDASRGFGGHALALTLMGRYLVDVFDGECCKRGLIPHLTDEEEKGGHAKCIMRAYEKWFEGMPECDLLTLMGLFDRPAEKGALDALLAAPVIDGLTNKIQGLSNEKYKLALKHLRKARLLAEQDSHEPDTLDCHPLLREHINEQLKEANLAAWREGNNRLYEYYKSAAKEFPDTIQEMAPLFAAILHGCQAERHQEVFNDVLWKRIKRQDKYYDTQILGAYGEDLAALSNFFEIPWIQPISSLESIDQASVLAWAGFHLRNLGRLGEAIDPLKAGLDTRVKLGRWERAAVSAGYLSEACLMLGNIQQAFDYSRQGVEFAERCNNLFWKGASRAIHANVLHHMGKLHEAEDIFRNIGLQRNLTNLDPYQYSVWGFYANDLLLSLGFYSEVVNKVKESLDIAISESRSLLDIALNKLILGRAYLLESQQEENHVFADKYTEQAMNDLRSAGTRHHLLYGLLARVEYYRVTGAFDKSQKDLDEAFSISTRGGMGLFLADCHLEYGRLALAQKGDHKDRLYKDKAREHLKTAKEMIAKMGYHRRDKEVEELEKEL